MYYFTLFAREQGRWVVAFGDYDRQVVLDEQHDSYSDCVSVIRKTKDGQKYIDAELARLNGGSNE